MAGVGQRTEQLPMKTASSMLLCTLYSGVLGQFMKSYMCVICGFVYEEEQGLPEEGIAPGTRWEDVPENWKCPECGATKSDFEMVEI